MAGENNHTDRFEELCTAYVLDALTQEERQEFQTMLEKADEEQLQLYHDMVRVSNHLAASVRHEKPAPQVKEQLMSRIREGAEDTSAIKRIAARLKLDEPRFAVAAATILVLIAVSLAVYSVTLNSELRSSYVRIEQLRNEMQKKEDLLEILSSRDIDVVIMSGQKARPDAYGKVIWDPGQQQAILQVANLPSVPKDKDYQLWMIKDQKPVSAGVFSVKGSSKDNFFKIEQLQQANRKQLNAFAITLEPKGGVPQPTGDMYLLGKAQRK